MKGVICAGGSGSRLSPLTVVTNKHLLAVYDKPMIFYPLLTLINAGITEIMIVCSNEHTGPFQKLLGSGREFGVDIVFKVQDKAGGIAEALGLCTNFVGNDDVTVILGDNIFEDSFESEVKNFDGGVSLFLKEVSDPSRFGVAELKSDMVLSIEEKPKKPKSNFAITGLYIFDSTVFKVISELEYSGRNELEITDVNNHFVKKGLAKACFLSGEWTDAGTFESLFKANEIARNIALSNLSVRPHSRLKKAKSSSLKGIKQLV